MLTQVIQEVDQNAETGVVIRKARPEDAERIVEMGRKFLLEGPYKDDIGDNPEVSKRVADLIIVSPMAHVLVAEDGGKVVGVFAMAIAPHFYSGEITACELIWYVEPEYRLRDKAGGFPGLMLLREAELYAHRAGATRMQMTVPATDQHEHTDIMVSAYKRLGYHQMEIGFQRSL